MAKKSFSKDTMGNPALQFISGQVDGAEAASLGSPAGKPESNGDTASTGSKPRRPAKTQQAKGQNAEAAQDGDPRPFLQIFASDGIGPSRFETKSKRVNLLFQPSLWDGIQKAAKVSGISANDFCCQVLRKYLEGRGVL